MDDPEWGHRQNTSSEYFLFALRQARQGDPQYLAQGLNARLNDPQLEVGARWHQDQLQIWLDADRVPTAAIAVPKLTALLQELRLPGVDQVQIRGIRRGAKTMAVVWDKTINVPQTTGAAWDRFSFDHPWVNVAALPVASLLAVILNASFMSFFLLPLHIWIHEFGHATIAWLSGRRALPLPFGWTSWSEERSLFVYFGILFLLGLMAHAGWREHLRWPIILAGTIAILQFVMTWLVPQSTIECWLVFGGIGGEFYLSTLVMIAFYMRLPDRCRWDFWRYVALVIAASSFWKSFWFWHQIQRGQEEIPWGSLLGGEGDAGGDMDRLVNDFGWTPDQIINTYTHLGNLCLLVLWGVYVIILCRLSPQLWRMVQSSMTSPRR
ncbi:hypothetical protein OOK60_05705 [Trichothermofontia sichuanensis B231]|uniref:hypothetical protein n=1 Tax=Trichothermofontia sichuanensis TaxID=3045816 RepID=UPI002245D1E9|nr:hypothetical protein [Trichothermofontia sichuanensis]UZQ55566.1 hypothetical protein OOK60_05705 [Trichothermofontia sichuanensis B231]